MQRESTIKFWDDFYVAQEQQEEQQQQQQQQQQQHQQGDATAAAEEPTISARAVSSSNSSSSSSKNLCKEWILQPSPALLQELAKRIITTSIVVLKRCCKGVVACQEQQTEPSNEKSGPIVIRILEIGSGTSCLARELCRYLNNNNITRLDDDNDSDKAKWNNNNRAVEFHVLATDVSHVCIEQNRQRDAQFLRTSLLQYQVLNVVQGAAAAAVEEEFKAGMFDVILDKGCLDTFLFRSRTRGSGPKRDYSPLVRTVLDNVHTWLATGQDVVRHDDAENSDNGIVSKRPEPHSSDGEHDSNESPHDTATLSSSLLPLPLSGGGVYLILSPRSKLKCVRDYRGFASVERHLLDVTQLDHGDLENGSRHRTSSNDCNSSSSNKEGVYLYTCHKNPNYSPAAIAATRGGEVNSNNAATESFASAFSVRNADTMTMENTTTTCPKCQLSLVDFFKNKTRGNKIAWTRKFQGHIHHCKGG
jgi:hypothetical protein